MNITVLTQPQPLVDIDDVKVAIGEPGTDRDDYIAGLILAAQAELDGPKGTVGITVAEQTVEVAFVNFDAPLYLPGGTIIDLSVVTYLDTTDAEQVLDPATYRLQRSGRLALVSGATWPAVSSTGDGVVATYDLGIIDENDPRISLMKTAIIMHVKMTLDMDDPDKYQRAIDRLVSSMRSMSL